MRTKARKEAMAADLPEYFSGTPCSKGHISLRTTKNGHCIACYNSYYEANKGRIKSYAKNYYQRNAERCLNRQHTNRAAIYEHQRNYRKENKPRLLSVQRQRRQALWPSYVKKLLTYKTCIRAAMLPTSLVGAKQAQINLLREARKHEKHERA